MSLEGTKAPAFSLEGSDGQTHTLAQYAGSGLILFFYPKDNTSGCTKEACNFTRLAEQFAHYGYTVLGVSKDSLASHQRFITAHGLTTVLLSDPDTTMMQHTRPLAKRCCTGNR